MRATITAEQEKLASKKVKTPPKQSIQNPQKEELKPPPKNTQVKNAEMN